MTWDSFIGDAWEARWDLLLLTITIIYRKELFKALAGGNGHLQSDEIAKGIIMLVFYLAFRAEVTRTDLAHNVFPESFWYAIIGGIFLIAGIKVGHNLISGKKKDSTDG